MLSTVGGWAVPLKCKNESPRDLVKMQVAIQELSGSSVNGIFQARILEQFAISYSRGSFQLKDQTHLS